MGDKKHRTYTLQESTIDWIDNFAEEVGEDKSDIVERAVRVYAMKLKRGEWKDKKFQDSIEDGFERL